jgi:hypothetical protein
MIHTTHRTRSRWLPYALGLLTLIGVPAASVAQYDHHGVIGSFGSASAGGDYIHLASSQPGSGHLRLGDISLFSGFLRAHPAQPGLDSDGDGLANEWDADNDNDGLTDIAEISGTAFDPVTPTDPNNSDSDTDGSSDAEEQRAGTNPNSAASLLEITDITRDGDTPRIHWRARGGRTYHLLATTDPDAGFAPVATNQAVGGSGAWQEMIGIAPLPADQPFRLFAIEVVP